MSMGDLRLHLTRCVYVGESDCEEEEGSLVRGLEDALVLQEIWPRISKSITEFNSGKSDDFRCLELLWSLRLANTRWNRIIDDSIEWAAIRLANADVKA